MAYPKLPDPMPPLNSPEYVALARKIAVEMGAAEEAPRTILIAERRKAERKYQRLISRVLRLTEAEAAKLVNPTVDDIIRVFMRVAASPQFKAMCYEAAKQTVTMMAVGQKRTWRAAAAASSNGRRIYQALMHETTGTALGQSISAIVHENAKLISTCPRNMAERFSELARKRQFEGVRPEDITKEIIRGFTGLPSPSILAFPRQPAKARPLTRWLRLRSSTGGDLRLQESFACRSSPAYRKF